MSAYFIDYGIMLTCELHGFPISLSTYTFSFITANDIDQSSSRSKEQHETVEQEYHTGRIKPCDACGSFCTILLLCDLLVGQVFT